MKIKGVQNFDPIDFVWTIWEISACPIYRSVTNWYSVNKIVIGVQHRQLGDKAGVDILIVLRPYFLFIVFLLLKYVLKEKSTSPKL